MNATKQAENTLQQHLRDNAYPGRGLVIGRMENGSDWLIVYFIMGRSTNSRNRRFVFEGDRLWTEPVDPALVEDPSLIIYDAMLSTGGCQLVSNGDQTRTLYEGLRAGMRFGEALAQREREPDAPNFTPRITGMIDFNPAEGAVRLRMLKANPCDRALTDRYVFSPALPPPGIGYGLTTYMGDGNPLPSFSGDPLLLPLKGDGPQVLATYWDALDADNRVSLAVKQIDDTGTCTGIWIKNRHGD